MIFFILIKNNTQSEDKKIKYSYPQDDLTLVTAYYKIRSKYSAGRYSGWIKNIVILNKSMVFFSNKAFMPILKELRPKEYLHKTVFIELEMEDFYSYKNFYKNFNESYYIDIERRIHSIPLYLVWAEKCTFLKKVILANYFNSKCFYWVDAGYFRDSLEKMKTYADKGWPTPIKCLQDNRVLMTQTNYFSFNEKQKIINFDSGAHKRLQKYVNVAGGFFGGQVENTLKFINLYYEALRKFIEKKIFIGKDQNVFAYVAFSHPDIMNLVFYRDFTGFKKYLS